jgi:hypothetical protein
MPHFPRATTFVLLGLLAACGEGQPLFDEDGTGDGDNPDTVLNLPPGTTNPTARSGINRYEAVNDKGGGMVTDVSYDARTDTFLVDNLAFDGENVYSRGTSVSSLNGYEVYEADINVGDSLTGKPINQIAPYRMLLGISDNSAGDDPRTSFAIVRTGGYRDFGFGGFLYERNGGVVLPTSGQARFEGDYAGVRVFNGKGGLEYTTGYMFVAIDFEDFNAGSAVRGQIGNRQAYDSEGNQIELGGENGLELPTLRFTVQAGSSTLDRNGEMTGEVSSVRANASGAVEAYEQGVYYGIVAGDLTDPKDGGEIVGVIVIESEDPRYDGITVQETGGFILYR